MRRLAAISTALALCAGAAQAAVKAPDETAFRAMFKEMVETDTSALSGDCTVLANRISARLTAAGFPAAQIQVLVPDADKRAGNLVAVLPGRDKTAPAVLMLGHIDVVNAKREDWTRDPFTLIEENGQFYGRGVSDMKAQDAIWADTLLRLAAQPRAPRRTVKLALTCGEEGGGLLNGASWLAANHRGLIDAGIALSEGGGGDLDAEGRKLAVTVMAAEKIFAVYTFEVTGPGGHSSKPRPENPITILGEALGRLGRLAFPPELNADSRAYFTALATRVDPETAAAMRAVLADPADPAAGKVLARSVSYNAMLRATCIPTGVEGGHAINAQPQRARATINCRLLPGQTLEAATAAITAAVADPRVTIKGQLAAANKPPPSPLTPAVMDPIRRVAAQVYPGVPVTPMQETFGTDAARLIAVGIPTYGFSGLFRGDDAGNIHGLNEHIGVTSVMEGREMLYRLIKAYAD